MKQEGAEHVREIPTSLWLGPALYEGSAWVRSWDPSSHFEKINSVGGLKFF